MKRGKTIPMPTAKEMNRFLKKVRKTKTCWIWIGAISAEYGRFSFRKKVLIAHRIAYTYWKGKIPNGKTINHECHNTRCVNPQHLVMMSHSDNVSDGNTSRRADYVPPYSTPKFEEVPF